MTYNTYIYTDNFDNTDKWDKKDNLDKTSNQTKAKNANIVCFVCFISKQMLHIVNVQVEDWWPLIGVGPGGMGWERW